VIFGKKQIGYHHAALIITALIITAGIISNAVIITIKKAKTVSNIIAETVLAAKLHCF